MLRKLYFGFERYLMKVILETRRARLI
jgi:hypothetical protein